jgi:hypothetical protein
MRQKVEHRIKELKISRQKVRRTEEKAQDWLKTMLEQVTFKDKKWHTDLFSKTTQDLVDTYLDEKYTSEDHSLSQYIFGESFSRARKAQESGKQSCKYSLLFLRFALLLQMTMKQDEYDFLSKIFNLPSSRTYAKYILPGGHAPDGVLYYVLYKQKEEFEGEMI